MSPAYSTGAPQQHSQPSRKGKRAWRKHVDIADVEAGLEEAREAEIKGGILADKPSEALFALDTTGSPAIQASYNKTHKPLMSDQILAQRSAIPPVDTHKRPFGVTDSVVQPSSKRRRADGVSPREYERLRQVAYGKQSVRDIINREEDTSSYDPWSAEPGAEAEDPRFSYLEKPMPIKAPVTLKEPPISLAASGKMLPAIPKPRPGASYNPLFQDWDALITSSGAKEVEAEKKRIAAAQAEEGLAKRIAAADKDAERETAYQAEDESVWEGIESDFDRADGIEKKRPQRKTPQERKKVEKRKEREKRDKTERKEKEKEKRERRIGELKAEVDRASKKINAKSREIAALADDQEKTDNTMLRRRRFGREFIPEAPLELVLPDELQDSLRLLKPEGNLLRDRFRNLLVRGRMETRKPITQPKKKRRTLTEKWTFKDFKVPIRMSSVDHGNEIEPAAAPAEQIAVDGSAGSDTDTGGPLKADSLTQDGPYVQHHTRSNSVKKPTTFKAVSVTKNFLAKAGTPAAPNVKVNGDNAAPQQPPKHLTDEELKQQYGIHLATRIQADGDGKEAKWADIDDDEDDWAPETIEWNDGTKITLSQNDPAALLAEEKAAAEAAKAQEEEQKKAKAAAQQKPTTTVGPNATVLKPRSAALAKAGGGLVLKAPAEKPTLVPKAAAPAPTKSPWAPLPVIEKVPPVEKTPPTHTSTPLPQENGILSPPLTRPPPPPALEIAADSFKRGSRDSQNDNVGRLYNAQSGNYEPANTGRRGSVRKDGSFRPPSVLQRGGFVQEVPAPREPSPALQTQRANQDEHAQMGRRESSTISADSGSQVRRHSTSRSSDLFEDRRGSQHSQAIQSPSTPIVGYSPAFQHTQLSQDARPTNGMPYQARAGSSAGGPPSERPDVAHMKQVMRERRDLAVKRRKEQEEREEAEKKERIRKKMEELGLEPLPEKKDATIKETKSIEKRPAEEIKAEKARDEKGEATNAVPRDIKQLPDSPSMASKSPPKPPAPHASGAPQQYGMIKVHSTSPMDRTQRINDALHVEKVKSPVQSQKVSPPGLEPRIEADKLEPSSLVNGITTQKPSDYLFPRSPELPNQQLAREARQQPWNNVPRDPYAGWNAQNVAREPNNVWGSSPQPRASGNGTFDRTIQRPQSRQQDQDRSPALAPIGPPKHLQPYKEPEGSSRGNNLSPAPAAEDSQTIPSFPPADAPQSRPSDMSGHLPNGEQKFALPDSVYGAPLAPKRLDQGQILSGKDQAGSAIAAWNNFQAISTRQDAEKRRQLQQQHEARVAEEARTGVRYEPQLPIMNETWKQVKVDEQGFKRTIVGVSKAQNPHGLATNIHTTAEIRSAPFVTSMDMASTMPSGLGRGSRFFPTAGRALHPYHQTTAPFSPFYRRNDSPPPPDSVLHPAFSPDTRQIIVRLPVESRVPKPKVRLPPSVITPLHSPQLVHVQPLAIRAASQPLVNNPSWQDRFNGLLGVKKAFSEKSPEKRTTQIMDFSATKEPLDIHRPQVQAAVTLPPRSELSGTAGLHVASKEWQDEEALFEPEPGSTPAVHFPLRIVQPAWSTPKQGPLKPVTRSKEVEVTSMEIFRLPDFFTRENLLLVFIKIVGMSTNKSKPMHPPTGYVPVQELPSHQGSPRQQNPVRGLKPQGKVFKSRESPENLDRSTKTSSNGPQKPVGITTPRNNYNSIPQSRTTNRASDRRPAAWGNITSH
ncbi:MAG: hypothetical protein Q9163_000958 [Psora crenata]